MVIQWSMLIGFYPIIFISLSLFFAFYGNTTMDTSAEDIIYLLIP